MPVSIEHERLRQAALDLLAADDFEGTAYDDITRRAAELCAAPVAIITVIDGHNQLFRSRVGTGLMSRPRELTFCTHACAIPSKSGWSKTHRRTRASRPTRSSRMRRTSASMRVCL